jgi:glyoxalase family protein
MHAVRLWEGDLGPTQELLEGCLGFSLVGSEAGWFRCQVEAGGSGKWIEIKQLPGERRGQWGVGSVHQVAWRVEDSNEQMALRQLVEQAGRRPTGQIDRFWFKSVYYKEPGGALFELAS